MKLYEFQYIDNENLPESELLDSLKKFLVNEAEEQEWDSGYSLHQCPEVQQSPEGGRILNFEVHGEYLDTNNIDDNQNSKASDMPNSGIAAKEVNP